MACHHEPSAASSVVGDGTCDDCDSALAAAQFLREDAQRSLSAPGVDHATVVLRHQLVHSTTHAKPGQEPGREWPLDARLLPTVLRI